MSLEKGKCPEQPRAAAAAAATCPRHHLPPPAQAEAASVPAQRQREKLGSRRNNKKPAPAPCAIRPPCAFHSAAATADSDASPQQRTACLHRSRQCRPRPTKARLPQRKEGEKGPHPGMTRPRDVVRWDRDPATFPLPRPLPHASPPPPSPVAPARAAQPHTLSGGGTAAGAPLRKTYFRERGKRSSQRPVYPLLSLSLRLAPPLPPLARDGGRVV